jgi:hypothetical protein
MNEVLTREEIEEQFDSEWVLLEDPELDQYNRVLRGKLLWHSKDRDELHQKASEFQPRHSAYLYVGNPPEGMEYIL